MTCTHMSIFVFFSLSARSAADKRRSPEIDSLVWLRAERRFRVVWRGFPRARATLEPAANLMPPGCAPRPFVSFPSLTTWCGQAGLHSCDVARADGGWSARPARRRGRPQHEGPAQAAHAAEGEEEVVALSKFMCARHACGAAGRRPPCSARSAQLPKPCTAVPCTTPHAFANFARTCRHVDLSDMRSGLLSSVLKL